MDGVYEKFCVEFCKADYLCHQGEPHWFGWFLAAFVVGTVLWNTGVFLYGFLSGLS